MDDDEHARRVGERLKALRAMLKEWRLPYTQKYMQDRLGVDQSHYSRYENGKTLIPAVTARRLAAVFMLTMGFIYDGNPTGIHQRANTWFRKNRPHLLGATTGTEPDTDIELEDYKARIQHQLDANPVPPKEKASKKPA